MNFIDVLEARNVYERGENVTEYLRAKYGETVNNSEIIEISYDLQAGSYVEFVKSNFEKAKLYTNELAELIGKHACEGDSLLDVGTGELTTLSLILEANKFSPSQVLAFDISWSRLKKGEAFFHENNRKNDVPLQTFVSDMKEIPLHSKSVDVIISSHALEPNGDNLSQLLKELFRVAKRKLVLFEPSYELNTQEGKERMQRLGYIKGMEATAEALGGRVLDIIPIKNVSNPLNPTACYVIEPPQADGMVSKEKPTFSVPGTNFVLERKDSFFASKDTGLIFPIFENIPILKGQNGILATAHF
ncbi:class I SAM-dependent methyltransferase [uncultured Cohaesibacter sp.]|uniref:class I SAM-dependent methyltransferase n=1 Tax=uncultured Cohaesibacter sp. TaxID=1002546 RepID=UPI00293042EC|nr:class I SAM-dependent methyltransferase [uncultured Cohaesibacter sp.]